ncbi:MAG TPA: heavy metal translocating P-type ATPase [Dermatophilaceae bacterium]|nr:heavy metal translocating P-type ATPase [Dermatophilaceae bacterium]
MTSTTTRAHEAHEVDLAITGMTCASCSARIEKKLNRLEGVQATVNLATEKASVSYADPLTTEDILAAVRQTGYGASVIPQRHDHDLVGSTDLGRRALIAGLLAVPLLLLAMVPALDFPGTEWVQFALATPVVFWAAWPFHRAAAINARHLASTMDTLVSLGVIAAYGWSAATVLLVRGGMGNLYFEVAAVVTTFLLLGRWLEARARARGKSAVETLLSLGAKDVAVQRIDAATRATTEVRIPVEDLQIGDHFVVRPGEKIATDGVVLEGSSAIDASLVTGESLPVDVEPGADVIGGTLNTHGRLVVEARRVGAETTLSAIAALVERAQTGKADVQRLADRISAVFVPIVMTLAVLTFAGWWLATGEPARALEVGVAVLIIACPCALGLATPTALLAGTGRGAQLGVLIKGPQVLEDTRRIDTIVFDKTGTVTTGVARLTDVVTAGHLLESAALQAAAAVEAGSEHPIAHAIVTAARERGLDLPPITGFRALPGSGARATIKDTEVTVGRDDLFRHVPDELREPKASGTTVYVGWDDAARAAITVSDEVRDTSRQAIADLAGQGLTAYLLTGDHERNARAVAEAVGIPAEHVLADVRPEEKHAAIKQLQAEGKVVAMVGDGINDAAALVQADLGLAMGSGTDAAMESADIVLMRTELPAVSDAIHLSRQTLRVIKQNLAWAFGYNAAAIPLAMAGLLNPMIAGGAMAMSSVLVVTNSLRLRGVRRH